MILAPIHVNTNSRLVNDLFWSGCFLRCKFPNHAFPEFFFFLNFHAALWCCLKPYGTNTPGLFYIPSATDRIVSRSRHLPRVISLRAILPRQHESRRGLGLKTHWPVWSFSDSYFSHVSVHIFTHHLSNPHHGVCSVRAAMDVREQ